MTQIKNAPPSEQFKKSGPAYQRLPAFNVVFFDNYSAVIGAAASKALSMSAVDVVV